MVVNSHLPSSRLNKYTSRLRDCTRLRLSRDTNSRTVYRRSPRHTAVHIDYLAIHHHNWSTSHRWVSTFHDFDRYSILRNKTHIDEDRTSFHTVCRNIRESKGTIHRLHCNMSRILFCTDIVSYSHRRDTLEDIQYHSKVSSIPEHTCIHQ